MSSQNVQKVAPQQNVMKNDHEMGDLTKADPFVQLHDVDHLIMQYMNVKDLLVMSEVSVDWNERAEKKLEKKVKLVLKETTEDEDFAALMASERNYESIELELRKNEIGKGIDVIRKFAPSIVDLKMSGSYIKETNAIALAGADFPKLKKLELKNMDSVSVCDWLYKSSFQLEELKIKSLEEIINITKLLAHQKKLTNLDCMNVIWKDVSEFVPLFSLKRLCFKCKDSFQKILDASRYSLEEIDVFTPNFNRNIVPFFNDYPNLTKFCNKSICFDHDDGENIRMNYKIENLKLWLFIDTDGSWHNVFMRFLLMLPNLKHLEVNMLTAEMMEAIATNMMKLETLTYKVISNNEPSPLDRYEELKADDLLIINRSIQLMRPVFNYII